MKCSISTYLLWIAVLALAVGQTPDCRAARSDSDYLVPQAYLRESGMPAEGFWTPKASQLREIERSLPTFLRKQMQSRPLGELSEVIALEPKYRRQYVGMILNGRKVIWVNCLPQESEKGVDPFANWNRQIIDVSDGGSDFWGVVYDIERHSFDKLILNGSA